MGKHSPRGNVLPRTLWEEEDMRLENGRPVSPSTGKHSTGPASIPFYRRPIAELICAL